MAQSTLSDPSAPDVQITISAMQNEWKRFISRNWRRLTICGLLHQKATKQSSYLFIVQYSCFWWFVFSPRVRACVSVCVCVCACVCVCVPACTYVLSFFCWIKEEERILFAESKHFNAKCPRQRHTSCTEAKGRETMWVWRICISSTADNARVLLLYFLFNFTPEQGQISVAWSFSWLGPLHNNDANI